ncbi:CLUMA_CG009551, isoform A [Clunio marinus]|uniref:CLUMA_CG009551, isoform A n=1 Tax=Clunio marinus TaxID=568069 RepID=A0A1J1ICF6_9DIPT|nr:CLUMA_CG009551, isoform A [Clunio marinus]
MLNDCLEVFPSLSLEVSVLHHMYANPYSFFIVHGELVLPVDCQAREKGLNDYCNVQVNQKLMKGKQAFC